MEISGPTSMLLSCMLLFLEWTLCEPCLLFKFLEIFDGESNKSLKTTPKALTARYRRYRYLEIQKCQEFSFKPAVQTWVDPLDYKYP